MVNISNSTVRRLRRFVSAFLSLVVLTFIGSLATSSAQARTHHGFSHVRHHRALHRHHHYLHLRRLDRHHAAAAELPVAGVEASTPTLGLVNPFAGSASAPATYQPRHQRMASGGAMSGLASYYGGRGRTASGGHVGAATCAHRSLPFGTVLQVTNLRNRRSMLVTVNDRGPFVKGRIIDVSTAAAARLDMVHSGVAPVAIQVVSR